MIAPAMVRLIASFAVSINQTFKDFEVIVSDDGSTDNSVAVLSARRETMPHLRIVRHNRSGGQSAAVHSGVLAATASVELVLLDLSDGPARRRLVRRWPADLERALEGATARATRTRLRGRRRLRRQHLQREFQREL